MRLSGATDPFIARLFRGPVNWAAFWAATLGGAAAAVATAGVTLRGTTYAYAGANPASTVSIGAPGAERTITNVAAGQITATSDVRPTDAQLREALPALTGDIMQVPPAFSAIKVAGERAYDLARAGQPPVLEARPAVFSFVFGIPSPEILRACRDSM